jgi:stage IV sporulation protein FB
MRVKEHSKDLFFIAIAACMVIYIKEFKYYLLALIPHEAAHFLCGKLLGYRWNKISFSPFGFNINFKQEFIKPLDDILISLSGPLINFVFFVLLISIKLDSEGIETLKKANLVLCVFNLLPTSFLDGGRILRIVIKSIGSFYKSYWISCLNGILTGCIIILVTLAIENKIQRLLMVLMGTILIINSKIEHRNIMVNVIRDIIYKSEHLKDMEYCDIVFRAFSRDTKVIDIIKYFCFNKYYIILIKESPTLKLSVNETEIINKYCALGNIKLHEAVKSVQEE